MDIKATKEWWEGICAAGNMTPDEAATLVHTVDDLIAEVERLSTDVVRLKKIEVAARAIAANAEECEFNDMMSFAASLDYLAELNGEVERLEAEGHTEHCAARHVWGDGQCECQKKGIIPGPVSQLVIDAVHPPILCESCQQMKFPACPYPYARGSAVECNCFTQAEAVRP